MNKLSTFLLCFSFLLWTNSLCGQEPKGTKTKEINLGSGGTSAKSIFNDSTETFSAKSNPKTIKLVNSKEAYLILDWVSPNQTDTSTSGNKVEVKVKIFSSRPVTAEHINIYKNQKEVTSKADEVSLFGQQKEINYTDITTMAEGFSI